MQQTNTSLFARSDTLLGVCEGLGQDLGVSPTIFRIAFGVALLWNPLAVIAAYVAVGIGMMLVHWLIPVARPAAETGRESAIVAQSNDDAVVPVAEAA